MRNYSCLKVELATIIWLFFLISESLTYPYRGCSNYVEACRCSGVSPRLKDCRNIETIKGLHLINCYLFHDTSKDFSDFTNLAVLSINNCSFSQIEVVDYLKQIKSLEELRIENTNISERILLLVAENNELTEVILAYNKIRKVCGTIFSHLPYLSKIDLSNNLIKEITINSDENCYGDRFAKPFFDLPELKHIVLRSNLIERLNSYSFGSMPKLQTLDLSRNKIIEIEPLTFNIKDEKGVIVNVHEVLLNISFNNLSTLRDRTFTGSDIITTLDLSNNHIRLIEVEAFTQLSALRHLHLSNNRLSALHRLVFLPLKALQELDLHKNQLTEIPADVFSDVKRLVLLDLSGNRIRQLDARSFQGLDSLRTLLLQENELQELGSAFMEPLPRLRVLQMAGNSVSEIRKRAFAGCLKLQELDLSRNDVSFIENYAFQNNAELKVLDLSSNALRWLPCHAFFGLRALRVLRLGTGNRLRSLLHVHVAPLHALRNLTLRLPPGSLCECAAFKQLQFQDVHVELDTGAKEAECFSFFMKLKDKEDFGDNCTLLFPQPDCAWDKREYLRWKSSGNTRSLPQQPLSTTASPGASVSSLKPSTPDHPRTSLMTSTSQPQHSTLTRGLEGDLPSENETSLLPTTVTSPTTSSTVEHSQSYSNHDQMTPYLNSFNFTNTDPLISSPKYTSDVAQLDLDSSTLTSNINGEKDDFKVNVTHQVSEPSTPSVKNNSQYTSLTPSIETVLISLMSISLLLSCGVIGFVVYKLCLQCRLKLLEWSHEYEKVHIDISREQNCERNQLRSDDDSSVYDSVDEQFVHSSI